MGQEISDSCFHWVYGSNRDDMGSKREKTDIRFHPGSFAVLLIEEGAHWGGETSLLESSSGNNGEPISQSHTYKHILTELTDRLSLSLTVTMIVSGESFD